MKILTRLAAVAIALAPVASSAAIITTYAPGFTIPSLAAPVEEDIAADMEYPYTFIATGTDSQSFTFTALETLRVLGVSFTSNGSAADVVKTAVSFEGGPLTSFSPVGTPGASTGVQVFGAFGLAAGESFTFLLDVADVERTALLTARFETTSIPVPAALPLLLGGIAALGVVSRKKKAAA